MGDLAPPVHCYLVTSSTGEPSYPSPQTKKPHSYAYDGGNEAVARNDNNNQVSEDSKTSVVDKEIPKHNDNNNNLIGCGSYGSPSVCYGPCDTTLTADDDDYNNNAAKFKEEEDDGGREDSFIVVESKRSKAKSKSFAAVAASVEAKYSKDATVVKDLPPTSFAKTQKCDAASSERLAPPPPLSRPASRDDKVTTAMSESTSDSFSLFRPATGSWQPQQRLEQQLVQQQHYPSYFSHFLGPFSSAVSTNGSSSAPGFSTDSSDSSFTAGTPNSQPKGGDAAAPSDPWLNTHYSLFSREKVGNSFLPLEGAEMGATSCSNPVVSSFSGSCYALPLKPASTCDGESNDGTESESGSVSGQSIDGLSRTDSVTSSSSSCHEEQPGKLFVGSLAASVTEQDLYKYFSQFGEVKSCFIKFDLGTNKSRGFGFVVFRDAEVINTVMGHNSDEKPANSEGIPQTRAHVIHGRPIHVRKAKPIAEMKRIRLKDDYDESQQKRVFIGGVPLEVTEEVIQTHFSKVGPVEKVILIFGTSENENGRHRGIGFVTFAQRHHAESAIKIRYHAIPEHFCTIECKPAIQKGDKSNAVEPPPKAVPSSGVHLTLADFRNAELSNAGKFLPTVTTTAAAAATATATSSSSSSSSSSILPARRTCLLPAPCDAVGAASVGHHRGSQGNDVQAPMIKVTPPYSQMWSTTASATATSVVSEESEELRYASSYHHANNHATNNALGNGGGGGAAPLAESRPPSALSVDSGYSGGLRSVSPASSEIDAAVGPDRECDRAMIGGGGGGGGGGHHYRGYNYASLGVDRAWARGSYHRCVSVTSGFASSSSDCAPNFVPSQAPRYEGADSVVGVGSGNSGPFIQSSLAAAATHDQSLLLSMTRFNLVGTSHDHAVPRATSSAAVSSSATPEHLRWFDYRSLDAGEHPGNDNDNRKAPNADATGASFVSSSSHALPSSSAIGLSAYGTHLTFAYADEMERFLADKLNASPPAHVGRRAKNRETGGRSDGGDDGLNDKIFRYSDANAAVKYEWNHWNSGRGDDRIVDRSEPASKLDDLPLAPLSRLTFLRDEPMEVRGANGSNGFDVYVR